MHRRFVPRKRKSSFCYAICSSLSCNVVFIDFISVFISFSFARPCPKGSVRAGARVQCPLPVWSAFSTRLQAVAWLELVLRGLPGQRLFLRVRALSLFRFQFSIRSSKPARPPQHLRPRTVLAGPEVPVPVYFLSPIIKRTKIII